MISYIVSASNKITINFNGKMSNIAADHPFYKSFVKALSANDEVGLEKLLRGTGEVLGGKAEFNGGQVVFNGKPLHNVLTNRIMELHKLGFSSDPMLRFLENLMANPNEASREELYDFLANKNLPITEDGCFLAYKVVNSQLRDKHSNTIHNEIGTVVEIGRDEVDPDRRQECSYGLHVGAMDYVRYFGAGCSDRYILVKVNPRDAIAVPLDHNAQKLRTCRYEILQEIDQGEVWPAPIYSSDGSSYNSLEEYDEDQEWEDDEDYEEEVNRAADLAWEEEEARRATQKFSKKEKQAYVEQRIQYYDSSYDRDNLARLCKEEGLAKSVEAARNLRKSGMLALLAGRDAKKQFS